MGMLNNDVLTERQKEAIRTYKYRGGDNSIAYKYLLSPMAQYFVDNWTPSWMAPNLITLIGFGFNVLAVILTLIYDPNLDNAPSWLPFCTAFCLFMYQTLDNMDGKQARKINASSPLGLLFDHGCDAISAGMTAVPLTSVFCGGWTANALWTAWVSAFFTFYAQTWEEYYLGEMFLPIFNGCSEGLICIISCCFISGIYGPAWWRKPSIVIPGTGLTALFPFQLLIAQIFVLVGPAIIKQFCTVLYKLYSDEKVSKLQRNANLQQAALSLLLIFTFVVSTYLWCFISKSALTETPVYVYFFMTSVFTEMATHMMLMHTTSSDLNSLKRFTAWSSMLLPLNAFYGNYQNVYNKLLTYLTHENITHFFIVNNQDGIGGNDLDFVLTPIVNEVLLIQVLTVIAVVVAVFKGYRMVQGISEALDVNVFVLGKRSDNSTATARKRGDKDSRYTIAAAQVSPPLEKEGKRSTRKNINARSKSPGKKRESSRTRAEKN